MVRSGVGLVAPDGPTSAPNTPGSRSVPARQLCAHTETALMDETVAAHGRAAAAKTKTRQNRTGTLKKTKKLTRFTVVCVDLD